MTEKGKTCSMWLKFFRNAGIPAGFDTKYAVAFDENRIKMDMLMDLNKECLRDIGITAMGDIIAILKHARLVHETNKEQAFESVKPTSSSVSVDPPKSVPLKATPAASSKSSVNNEASRSSNKLQVNSTTSSSSLLRKTVNVIQKRAASTISPYLSRNSSSVEELSDTSSQSPQKSVEPTSLKREYLATKKVIVLKKRTTSDSDGVEAQREEVPVQKKVRVLPEHEGSYKIKMPEGSIPRTQKLQTRLGPSLSSTTEKKSNIFDRLGGERSSASSGTSTGPPMRQPITLAASETKLMKSSKNLSIFDRLGGRQGASSVSSTSTSVALQNSKKADNDYDFMKTKFTVRRQIEPPSNPSRPKPDPAVYREKTLTTIQSSIYTPPHSTDSVLPSSSRQPPRLKSEILKPDSGKAASTINIRSRLGSSTKPPISPPLLNRRYASTVKINSSPSDSDYIKDSRNPPSNASRRSSKVVASAKLPKGSDLYNDHDVTTGEIIKVERFQNESGQFFQRRMLIRKKRK